MDTTIRTMFKRWGSTGLLMAILLGAISAFLFASNPSTFGESYFFGWIMFTGLSIGCLGLITLHHTVRGSWGLSMLRMLEAGASPTTFVVLALLFIPIAFQMPHLYHHWMHPEEGDLVVAHKAGFLNQGFFLARTAFYFLVWIGYANYFRKSTLKEDATGDAQLGRNRSSMGGFGLVVFVLVGTLAVTDWLMSLDPHWFSTMYGVWFIISLVLFALGLMTLLVTGYGDREPFNKIWTGSLGRDLGNMMFMFTMFWAYVVLSQWLIIWSGNLPEFIRYYERRDAWRFLGAFNIFFAWFVPWMLLLSPRVKRERKSLMMVALIVVVMRIVDLYWNIIPFFRLTFQWTDIVSVLFFGSVWVAVFGRETAKAPLLPVHDQRLEVMAEEANHVHA